MQGRTLMALGRAVTLNQKTIKETAKRKKMVSNPLPKETEKTLRVVQKDPAPHGCGRENRVRMMQHIAINPLQMTAATVLITIAAIPVFPTVETSVATGKKNPGVQENLIVQSLLEIEEMQDQTKEEAVMEVTIIATGEAADTATVETAAGRNGIKVDTRATGAVDPEMGTGPQDMEAGIPVTEIPVRETVTGHLHMATAHHVMETDQKPEALTGIPQINLVFAKTVPNLPIKNL